MLIDIEDYSVNIVGMRTLEMIERRLEEYLEQGKDGVIVDLRDRGINKEYNEYLAKLQYKYKCIYRGIGNKEHEIDAYLKTGYFLKESMLREEYAYWFKEKLEESRMPLIIRDNRLRDTKLVSYNVVKPIKFTEDLFHYYIIKPQYLEPEDLKKAIEDGQDIFTKETTLIGDIGRKLEGFRYAASYKEYVILDIFKGILERNGYDMNRVK